MQEKARIPHGASLAIMLPAVMEYDLKGNPQKYAEIADLLGEDTKGLSLPDAGAKAVTWVRSLIDDLRLPSKLSEVGITEADADLMAKSFYETATYDKFLIIVGLVFNILTVFYAWKRRKQAV